MATKNTRRTNMVAVYLLVTLQQCLHVLFVWALPTQTLVSRDNGQSGSSGGSDGTFQTLASGTQDLAALAGVFATDSVERYAFDYTKGFLVPAMANCSLLGVLGFVRGLLKLGIGRKACQRAGYSIEPLQPYMGVADDHLLPPDKSVTVTYLECRKIGPGYEWRVVKSLEHTDQSLPALSVRNMNHRNAHFYRVDRIYLSRNRSVFITAAVVANLVAVAATSFPVLVLTENSWQSLLASCGLFASLSTGSLLWIWTFSQEQMPQQLGGFFDNSDSYTPIHTFEGFAFWQHECHYGAFRCRAVSGHVKSLINALSVLAALAATAAYLFQYISLQEMTTEKVGIWVGWQAGLMLLRLFVWIWSPSFQSLALDISQEPFIGIAGVDRHNTRSFHALRLEEILMMHFTSLTTTVRLSRSLAEALYIFKIQQALEVARLIEFGKSSFSMLSNLEKSIEELEKYIEEVKKSQDWWDFEPAPFSNWLASRASSFNLDLFKSPLKNICCRIVRTGDGTLHLLPAIMTNVTSQTTGDVRLIFFGGWDDALHAFCFLFNGPSGGKYIDHKEKRDLGDLEIHGTDIYRKVNQEWYEVWKVLDQL